METGPRSRARQALSTLLMVISELLSCQHALIAPQFVPLTWTHASCCSHVRRMFTTRYCLKQTARLLWGTFWERISITSNTGNIDLRLLIEKILPRSDHLGCFSLDKVAAAANGTELHSDLTVCTCRDGELEGEPGLQINRTFFFHCLCIHWFWLKLCLTAGEVGPHANMLLIKPPNDIFLVRRSTN